jgi:NAD(P)-dependent dehydrogenase (short-subunit alcohol dehydrogenase family)
MFDQNDQALFACLSADFNPMHMDPVAARRTQAGAPVVHGIHAALWGLDKIVEAGVVTSQIVSLSVQFNKFIYVGSTVGVNMLQRDEKTIKAEVALGGLAAITLVIGIGTRKESSKDTLTFGSLPEVLISRSANVLNTEHIANMAGRMNFAAPAEEVEFLFPYAASEIGRQRVAAITALSRLVGMICPGLHSLFSGFAIELVNELGDEDGLSFRVSKVYENRRIVRMHVSGAGMCGSVLAFVRVPPVVQAPISDIAKIVSPSEFAGNTALIIGGSRGLGELTAKIIAAGGGKVIITYATGREDAVRLANEVNSEVAGSACHLLQLDVRDDIAKQLSTLEGEITHLFYFATPNIFRQKEGCFVKGIFDDFFQVYVNGFYDCCQFLASRRARPLIAFYPSSVAVDECPLNMTEYSIAKSAGEMLCAAMNRSEYRIQIVVNRLPRILTDQTATVIPVKNADSLEVMLPIIRNVQLLRP